jgi:hypothetical protein
MLSTGIENGHHSTIQPAKMIITYARLCNKTKPKDTAKRDSNIESLILLLRTTFWPEDTNPLNAERLLTQAVCLLQNISILNETKIDQAQKNFWADLSTIGHLQTREEFRAITTEYFDKELVEPEELLTYAVGLCWTFFHDKTENPPGTWSRVFAELVNIFRSHAGD